MLTRMVLNCHLLKLALTPTSKVIETPGLIVIYVVPRIFLLFTIRFIINNHLYIVTLMIILDLVLITIDMKILL